MPRFFLQEVCSNFPSKKKMKLAQAYYKYREARSFFFYEKRKLTLAQVYTAYNGTVISISFYKFFGNVNFFIGILKILILNACAFFDKLKFSRRYALWSLHNLFESERYHALCCHFCVKKCCGQKFYLPSSLQSVDVLR